MRRRALIVEDSAEHQELLRLMLEDLGWEAAAVTNGFDAWTEFDKDPFDVVLMDLEVPGPNGFETTARILLRHPGCYVVAQTAHVGPNYQRAAYAWGMREFLPKPVTRDGLLGLLQRAEDVLREAEK